MSSLSGMVTRKNTKNPDKLATVTPECLPAREYLRVSVDRSGRERSPEEQHADHEQDAAEHGWRLGQAYRDLGSASKYARKARDEFDRLLSDLDSGQFAASVLVMWESSRGSRREGEWVTLLDLCADHAVLIYVHTHHRLYDPRNPRDRRSLMEDAVDAAYESGKMSERALRARAADAADGRPAGQAPYGYRRRFDPQTRKLIGQEPHPEEAAVVRELFGRLHQGHTLYGIAKDFAARGIEKKKGGPFSQEHLRHLARCRSYNGERVHLPSAPGQNPNGHPDAKVTKGQWEPLVSREVFLSVQRILDDPTRVTTRPGKARHLLSMIARCGPCGNELAVAYPKKGRTVAIYVCRGGGGHVRVDKAELDGLAEAAILGYLSRDDVHAELTAAEGQEEVVAAARAEVVSIGRELDELGDEVGAGRMTPATAARAEQGIRARLVKAQVRERELSTPSALRRFLDPGADIRARWDEAEISSKREIARLVLATGALGELRLERSPIRGHRVPVEQRVSWRRSDG